MSESTPHRYLDLKISRCGSKMTQTLLYVPGALQSDSGRFRLEKSTWDFPTESSDQHITALHPYPARFIPAIPCQAIRLFGKSGGVVWDPFAGCGTTLVEATSAGLSAAGIDTNPLACLLQRVYTTRLNSNDWASVSDFGVRVGIRREPPALNDSLSVRSDIPALAHWFGEGSIRAIDAYLRSMESAELSQAAEDVARFALSRVVVRLSRQQSDTQYRAVRPDPTVEAALMTLDLSVRETLSVLRSRLPTGPGPRVEVRNGDARDPKTYDGLEGPDLVVTSPPYPNSYEYWLYHKYRMFWLGMDPIWARSHEIGARPFYSGTGKMGPAEFTADLRSVMRAIDAYSKPETIQVWVVGDAIIKGTRFDTAASLMVEAEGCGWNCIQRFERRVARHRSSFQGIGRLKTESILVFQKAKG